MIQHVAANPCPICAGHRGIPQGQGRRCFGFTSSDGFWADCTRGELAGSLAMHSTSQTYSHRLQGPCKCGVTHGEAAQVRSIGEARGARIVATYDYTDEAGALLYQVVRKEPKTFVQRQPDGAGGWRWKTEGVRQVLYRLPELASAVAAGDTVHVVEGEKDANAVHAAGGVATCNAGGAGKWRAEFASTFAGADVVIVRDRDEPGNEHARQVFASLRKVAASIRVVEARAGKDAADHLGAGHTLDAWMPVWPLANLRESNPVAWKQAVVRSSLDPGDPFRRLDLQAALAGAEDPKWPTGLAGPVATLPNFRGVTILTGGPSSGKSFLAIASAVQATRAGWDVLYLSSEMGDRVLARRFSDYCAGNLPERLHVQCVSFGANVSALVDLVAEQVGVAPMLVIFDSISSFVDQAITPADSEDVHQIGPLRQLLMWALNVKRNTEGVVSFLVLSETNREGRTKGRFGDHKADLVVTLVTDENVPGTKHLTVVKGWEYQTGPIGAFGLDWRTGRLVRIE